MKCLAQVTSFHLLKLFEEGSINFPVLHMRKIRKTRKTEVHQKETCPKMLIMVQSV